MESLKKLYKMTKLYEQNLTKGKKDTVVKLFRRNKKMISKEEVRQINEQFSKLNKGNVQIMLRGRNKHRMTTIKGFQEDILEHDNEYYANVGDDFDEFFYLEITLRK